jgi:hypothetical protein
LLHVIKCFAGNGLDRSGALRQMCFTFSLANLVGSAPSIFPLAKGHRIRYNRK